MKPASNPLSPNSGVESSSRSDGLKNRRKRSKKRSVVGGGGEKAPTAVDKCKIAGDGAAWNPTRRRGGEKREQNAVKFLNVDAKNPDLVLSLGYASISLHDRNDVSRRDDFWQLFYQFVELLSGQLPWRMYNDKAEVGKMKQKFPPEAFCRVFPPEIGQFVANLRKLNFEEKPDYNFLASCFENAADNQGHETPFDWELEDCILIKHWKPPYYQ